MTTHISYKTAKALKEFLADSAPEPMDRKYFLIGAGSANPKPMKVFEPEKSLTPAYQLHDLLSKPFCEAMANKLKGVWTSLWVADKIAGVYFDSGLPAVEAELIRLMEAK